MNNYISYLNIQTFRGIKDLKIDNIGSINILVGGNNTGKTSVLEAIQLFCNPNEYDMIRISRQRDRYRTPVRTSLSVLDSLLFMFNVNSDFDEKNNYAIGISGNLNHSSGTLTITGECVHEMLDLRTLSDTNPVVKAKLRENDSHVEEEVSTFVGSLTHTFPRSEQISLVNDSINVHFEINEYSRFIGRSQLTSLIDVEMINTVDHILQNTFSILIKNKEIKDISVEMLKKFDSSIEDIRYINAENRFVPVIENSKGKYIPLSLYGDGMKKALTILNAIVAAKGGIVLIDEFETALHTSVMNSVFKFMVDVAKTLQVQLFLTTHSIESVDKLLDASRGRLDDVRVIRLKKTKDKMYAKVTTGDIALENRMEYDMELRI